MVTDAKRALCDTYEHFKEHGGGLMAASFYLDNDGTCVVQWNAHKLQVVDLVTLIQALSIEIAQATTDPITGAFFNKMAKDISETFGEDKRRDN